MLRGALRFGLLFVGLGVRSAHGRKSGLHHDLHRQHGLPLGLALLCFADWRRQRVHRERGRDRADLWLPIRTNLLRLGLLRVRLNLLSGFCRGLDVRPDLHR